MEEPQNKRIKLKKSKSGAEMIKTKLPFPDEIYLKIFSYLSTNDILENVARVCQEFYRLSKDAQLIKEIEFEDISSIMHYVKNNCSNFYPNFDLNLPNVSSNLLSIKKVVIQSRGLTKLTLQHRSELCREFEGLMSAVMKSCPKLKHLDVEVNHCCKSLFTIIANNGKSIQNFRLNIKTPWSNEPKPGFDSKNLIALANNWQNLKSIEINQEEEFTKESVNVLLSNRGPSLKYLRLSENKINYRDDTTFKLLFKHNLLHHLHLCKELEKLSIENIYARRRDETVPSISNIPKMENIKELRFKNIANWRSEDLIALFVSNKLNNSNLVKIELLENWWIDINVLRTIAAECQNLKSLTFFSDSNCEDAICEDPTCEDYGCEKILNECIDLFKSGILKNLKELDISKCFNHTSDDILKSIAFGCPQLETLEIELHNINDLSIMSNFCNLKKLVMWLELDCKFTFTSKDFVSMFSNGNLRNLNHLEFGFGLECLLINDDVIKMIASECQNLQYLKLPGCSYNKAYNSEEAIKCLFQNGKKFKTMYLCRKTTYSKKFILELKNNVTELFWDCSRYSTKIIRITESSLMKIPNSKFHGYYLRKRS